MKKKVVLEPAGKDLKQFQAKYASDLKRMIDHPAYQAAVQFLRNRKTDSIAMLSPDQIEKSSKELLGDLKGYLQHENDLTGLYEMTEFTIPFEEDTRYISPEEEAEQEQLRAKYQKESEKQRYAH